MKHAKPLPFLSSQLFTLPLIICTTILAYFSTLHFPFHFDDIANITQNFAIRSFSVWEQIWTSRRWFGEWMNATIFRFDGFNPEYYRATNILIHLIGGLLVAHLIWWICSRTTQTTLLYRQRQSITALTTLFFLLHPVQTQTISYIIQGKLEGLASILMLAALSCLLHALEQKQSRTWHLAFGFFFTFLACGTKEIAIVTPLLLLLLDWFFIAQQSYRILYSRRWFYFGYFLFTGSIMAYYLKPQFFITLLSGSAKIPNNRGNALTETAYDMITPYPFCISQFKVLLHYLWIFIWPFSISVEYDWKLSTTFFSANVIIPFIVLGSIVALLFHSKTRHKTPWITFGLLWFFITMAPRTSIIPSQELMCDYKTYLASVGWLFVLSVLLIFMLEKLSASYKRQEVWFASFFILTTAIMGFTSYTRNQVWQNGETFWRDIVNKAPFKPRSHNNYGIQLTERGKWCDKKGDHETACAWYQHAIRSYEQAIALDRYYPEPYANLSMVYTLLKDIDKAIDINKQAITLLPHYPIAHLNLGTQLLEKGEYENAEAAFKTTIAQLPHSGKAYYNLARVYEAQEQYEAAQDALKKACAADFDTEPTSWLALGKASIRLGKYDEARAALETSASLDHHATPERTLLRNTYLAHVYHTLGQQENAAQCYHALTQQEPTESKHWHNLAECYFGMNDYRKARTYFEKSTTCPHASVQTYLRIAHCLEKENNLSAAKNVVQDLLIMTKRNDLPSEVIAACQSEVQRINTLIIVQG